MKFVDEILNTCIQIKRNQSVVLSIALYEVILTVESVDEMLKCDHSNKSY